MLKELGKGFLLTLGRQVITLLTNLITSVILARSMTPSEYGEYIVLIVYASFISSTLSFGLGTSNSYYIARGKNRNEVFSSFLYFYIAISIFVFPLIYIGISSFTLFDVELVLLTVLAGNFLMLNQLLISVFQGDQNFKKFNTSQLLYSLILFLFQGALVLLDKIDLEYLLITIVFANIIQIIYNLWFLKAQMLFLISRGFMRKHFLFGIKNHLSNIVTLINYRGDVIIIERYLPASRVAVYNIGVNLIEKVWVVSTTLSTALFPKLSELSDKGQQGCYLTIMLSKLILLFNLLIALFVYLLVDKVVLSLYGIEYVESVEVIYILFPGIALMSMSRLYSNYLASINKPMYNFYASIVIVVLNLGLNILLIPEYNILGAAYASTIAYSLSTFLRMILFVRFSGIRVKELFYNIYESQLIKKLLLKLAS